MKSILLGTVGALLLCAGFCVAAAPFSNIGAFVCFALMFIGGVCCVAALTSAVMPDEMP